MTLHAHVTSVVSKVRFNEEMNLGLATGPAVILQPRDDPHLESLQRQRDSGHSLTCSEAAPLSYDSHPCLSCPQGSGSICRHHLPRDEGAAIILAVSVKNIEVLQQDTNVFLKQP